MEPDTKNKISHSDGFDTNRLSRADLLTIIKVSHMISEAQSIKDAVAVFLKFAVGKTGADRGLLFIFDKRDNNMVYALPNENSQVKSHADARTVIDVILQKKTALIVNDPSSETQFCRDLSIKKNHIKSFAGIPLFNRQKIFGALYLENEHWQHAFSHRHIDLLQITGCQLSISLENARYHLKRSKADEHYRHLFKKKIKHIQRTLQHLFPSKRQHDIRSSINAIIGYADFLKASVNETPPIDPQTASNHLDEIQHRGRLLLEAINAIFDSPKRILNQSGGTHQVKPPSDLNAGITEKPSSPAATQKMIIKIDYALDSWTQLVTALKKAEHQWHSIRRAMIIQDIENFGMHIIRMGDQFQSSAIESWGRKLREHTVNLDKTKIETTFQLFPEIVLKVQERKPGELEIELTP